MIECPFCGESFEEDELVFEFNWGEVATFYYNRKKLNREPSREYTDRAFYVRMRYDRHGRPLLAKMTSSINPLKHPGNDPMCSSDNEWSKVEKLLSDKKIFEVESDDEDHSLPVAAKILPLIKNSRKQRSRPEAEGMSTGMFCPMCEQQLKASVLKAKSEIRILLCGRPGSGKTVYAIQALSELMQGRLAQAFNIEAANDTVREHFDSNKRLLKALSSRFVQATNPGVVQHPYVYLLSNGKSSIRLVIQDIAGEDVANRTKYKNAVLKADMLLFFIDPWHIEEIRMQHEKNNDHTTKLVRFATGDRYLDMGGVFTQMMGIVDRKFTEESKQLAGVLLVKGDYLDPPMLARGSQPECQMMQQPIPFHNPAEMEFSIGMRSSFIRQCMHEWESTRVFAREVENKYNANSIRYFVTSALGHSTVLRQAATGEDIDDYDMDDPDAQFGVGSSSEAASDAWTYGEQVLSTKAIPENVIDPIFWCLRRKGIQF